MSKLFARPCQGGAPSLNPSRQTLRTPSPDSGIGCQAPSAGLGSPGQALSAGSGHRAKPFFRVPEVTFGRLVLTKPILQKSSFRRGEMAVLLLSGSWPGLRIGPKTAAKKSNAYLGPVPGGVTTFWGHRAKPFLLAGVRPVGVFFGFRRLLLAVLS